MSANKHPMTVAVVSIFVADPAKAFAYYTDVLGFEEVMFAPEQYIAVVKSPLDPNGVTVLLEPTEPGGIEIAKQYKQELYSMNIPCITFGCVDIDKTYAELTEKGVVFKQEPTSTEYGKLAMFDDDNGNYIQLFQLPSQS